MKNNESLFLFVLFVSLSNIQRGSCSIIKWIGTVVAQRDITHNKILFWVSLILCAYRLFYHFRNWIYAL